LLNAHTIERGLNSSFENFENAFQYFSATESQYGLIITRNAKDLKKSRDLLEAYENNNK